MALYPLSTKCYKDNLLFLFDETEEDKNKTKIFLQSSGNGVYYEKWGHKDSIIIIIITHVSNYMCFPSRHSSPHSYLTLHDICFQELPLINQHRNNNGPHHATPHSSQFTAFPSLNTM